MEKLAGYRETESRRGTAADVAVCQFHREPGWSSPRVAVPCLLTDSSLTPTGQFSHCSTRSAPGAATTQPPCPPADP